MPVIFLIVKLLSSHLPFPLKPKTIILPAVYECETSPLTQTDQQHLKVLENKVLQRIFGTKKDLSTGDSGRYTTLNCMLYLAYRMERFFPVSTCTTKPILIRLLSRQSSYIPSVCDDHFHYFQQACYMT